MKRILIVLMMLAAMCTPAYAAAGSRYIDEDYNAYPAGSEPVGVTVKGGKDSHIVRYGEKENALMLSDEEEGFVSANWSMSEAVGECFIEFEAEFDDIDGGKVILYDRQKNPYDLFVLRSGARLYTGEGRAVGAGLLHKSTRVGVYINAKTKRLDVYIDGRARLVTYYAAKLGISQIKEIQLNLYPDGKHRTQSFIKYMRCYGSRVPVWYERAGLNPAEREFVPQSVESERVVYFDVDFENATATPLSIVDKGNSYTYVKDGENTYLEVSAFQQDSYFEKQFSQNSLADNVILEMDVNIKKVKNPAYLFSALYYTGVIGTINEVYISSDNSVKCADGTLIAELKPGKWYNLAMKYSFSRGSFDFYVDGELVIENHPLVTKSDSMRLLRVYMPATEAAPVNLLFDNVKMYSGKTLIRDGEKADEAEYDPIDETTPSEDGKNADEDNTADEIRDDR